MKTIITMTTYSHNNEWTVYKVGIHANQYRLYSISKGLGWFPSEWETEKENISPEKAKELINIFLRSEIEDEGTHQIINQKLLDELYQKTQI